MNKFFSREMTSFWSFWTFSKQELYISCARSNEKCFQIDFSINLTFHFFDFFFDSPYI